MPAFTVTARFPLGEFNAHGAGDAPEWPPAPARLAAAILAAAHREGVGAATAERFFSLRPPEISTPRMGYRNTGFSRWVPVNNALTFSASGKATGIVDARDRFGQKAQKAPECGVMVGRTSSGGSMRTRRVVSTLSSSVGWLGVSSIWGVRRLP